MSVVLAGIGAAAAIGSVAGNAIATGKMNKRAERFSREMYDKQRQHAVSDWNTVNAYNDPSAQMKRLQDAGLNPNLVYGNGSASAGEATAPRSAQSSQPNYRVPEMDFNSVVQQAMATQQSQANIRRTEAETDAINTRTISDAFKNSLNDAIGIDAMANNYNRATDIISIKSEKDNADWEAYKIGAFQGQPYDSPNSPVAKAIKAGFEQSLQNLRNAKVQEDVQQATAIIQQFQAGLTKQGLSPNSPWYVKFLGDLLKDAGLFNNPLKN